VTDRQAGFGSGTERPAVDEFFLQGGEERFGGGVVPTHSGLSVVYTLLFVSIGPLLLFLSWTFLAPQGTDGSAEAARAQYFEKAPQSFGLLAAVAAWAVVLNAWLVGGAEGTSGAIGWIVGLVLFVAISRSSNARLHGAVVTLAWILLIGEVALEISRGLPAL
jgi:hypothetical protein